jgi:hypothetical protein
VLAGLLTLAISFLAGFLGLGKIADKVMEIIKKIRAPIDKALDFLVNWIVNAGKKLFGSAKQAVKDWWKKTKPFTTKGGHKHELSYQGEEKNAVPMVASDRKLTIVDHAAAFKKQAGGKDATEEQKKAASIIDATVALAKKDPSDPDIVTKMQFLFETYDEGGAFKEWKVTRVTGNLGGATVGMAMSVDWLNAKHPGGSPPGASEQAPLMDQLITKPKTSSEDKFIRGHLLNENLGGLGVANNMFPITANANKNHLTFAETEVKKWVEDPNNYVFYEVKVGGVKAQLNGKEKDPGNFVDCQFICNAQLKDAKGKVGKTLTATIPSEYKTKHTKETTDFKTGEALPAPAKKK